MDRLVKYFVPKNYKLLLEIDKTQHKVLGVVNVTGEAMATTIKLHTKDLDINRLTVCSEKKRAHKFTQDGDELTIYDVRPGETTVTIEYEFELTDSMHGAYLSTYQLNGKTETIIATQFESHYAREVFPCIDEPEAKAVFDLTITTPDTEDTVVSNMPVLTEVVEPVKSVKSVKSRVKTVKTVHFTPTPRMSTYLLAFCVGKFQRLSGKTKSGIDVSIYATPAQNPESLILALDIATRCLDFYEEYFDVPYPLPKCDHLGLPDLEAAAMENWGLITCREACLLADPQLTPLEAKRLLVTVIAHELAHMWFGNLVTMRWWDDLWLNESFATVMEYVAVNAIEPTWQIWKDFDTSYMVSSLRRDAMDGVQPVYQDVNHPDEIQALFDPSIVYGKGACLMRMLMHMISEEDLRKGLRAYFEKHAYQNTEGSDLWAALSVAAGIDVGDFMNWWIDRPGYPVVKVELELGKITLTQQRFTLGSAPQLTYPIPLDSNLDFMPKILDITRSVVEDKSITLGTVVRLNQSGTGQFITSYDAPSFTNLLNSVDITDSLACFRIMTEQTLLANAGLASTLQIFELLEKFAESSDDGVWSGISLALRDMSWFVEIDTPEYEAFKKYRCKLAEVQYKRLGWQPRPTDTDKDVALRSLVAGLMIAGGSDEVVGQAVATYDAAESLETIDQNLRCLVLTAKVRYDETPELIDKLINQYHTTPSSDIRNDIGVALCSSKNPVTIKKLLNVSLDKTIVRLQDTAHWLVHLMRNRRFTATAWKFYRQNWSWFERELGGDKHYANFPRYMAATLYTRQQLHEYEDFFGPKSAEPALARNINVGIKEIRDRVQYIAKEAPTARRYLLKQF
ncbi:MAG: M1 family metallopeptidase [Candidatus Nomurabacteria bacterium]|nr:M1 family metallopeptidase [Candidatus Nomurabacteria bacterium]